MMNLLRFSVVLVLLLGLANGQINFSTSWGKRSPSPPSSTGQQQQQLSPSLLQFISNTRPDLFLHPQQQKESAGHVAACRSLHLLRQSIDAALVTSSCPDDTQRHRHHHLASLAAAATDYVNDDDGQEVDSAARQHHQSTSSSI